MKCTLKCLYIFTFLLLSYFSQAQIEKGKWISGLNFSFSHNDYHSSQTNRDQKSNGATVGVSIGRFISRSLVLGVGFTYNRDYSKDAFSQDSYSTRTATNYGGNIYLQYFKNIEGKLYYTPYLNFSNDWSTQDYRNKVPNYTESISEQKVNEQIISLRPLQVSYLVKNRVLLQAGFGAIEYIHSHTTSNVLNADAEGASNGFSINFSPTLSNIGISIIF